MAERFVGKGVNKVDAQSKVTGEARYTEDLVNEFDDLHYVRVLRAPHPHAYLRSIDTSEAEQVSGVVGVYTAADFPELNEFGLIIKDQPVLVKSWRKDEIYGRCTGLCSS